MAFDNKAYGMFVLSAATFMPGESREPFLVICQARKNQNCCSTCPPQEPESGLPDFHLPSTQDVETPIGNIIACVNVFCSLFLYWPNFARM
jgi:hypothetical protein